MVLIAPISACIFNSLADLSAELSFDFAACGIAAYFAVKGSQKPPESNTLTFSMKNQAKSAKYTESTSLWS